MRASLLSLSLSSLLAVGCRHKPPAAPVASEEEQVYTPPPSSSPEPEREREEVKVTTPRAATKAVQGVWVVALSESELRRLRVLEYALARHAPSEADLRAEGLSDDELQALRELRALSPDSPELQSAEAVVERMRSSSLEITDEVMRFESGARQQEVRWTLVEQEGNTLTVQLEEDGGRVTRGTLRLGDDGTLVLVASEGQQLTLRRKGRGE